MKKTFFVSIAISVLTLLLAGRSAAQFPEDALRFSTPSAGIGARSLGLGGAVVGISSDFSAVFTNPAGLGQIKRNEFSLGLSHYSYGNTSSFFNNTQSLSNSSTSLNSLGIVYPFPTSRGSLVLAIGYGKYADYTTGLSFKGFNPGSSIIQTYASDGDFYPGDLSDNIAYQLYLANIDTINGRFISPLNDSLTQSGKVLEGGGLNHVSIAGAVEAARNVYLGLTLNFLTGSYSYSRSYHEDDLSNVYGPDRAPFDVRSFSQFEIIESDLSGFTMKLGMLYKIDPNVRLGLAIKTPSWITVHENFSTDATSSFDNGDTYEYPSGGSTPSRNEYDVVSPYVLSAGLSVSLANLLLAGDVEYTDWTQIEFRNANSRLLSYNTDIKELFRPTATGRVGAEFTVNDFRVRGGFMYIPSQFNNDPSSFAQKYITGGAGFIVDNSIALDVAYTHGYWDTFHINYDSSSRTKEKIRANNITATVTYRF